MRTYGLVPRLLHCKRVFNADLQKTLAGIQWKLVILWGNPLQIMAFLASRTYNR
jgi:hypothetical protein